MQVKVKMKGPLLAREKALESRSMLAQGKASLLTERLADRPADRPAGQDLSCQDLSCQDLLEQ